MPNVRFAIYANAPFGLNYYSPQNNLANAAGQLYQGNNLRTQEAVTQAIDYATEMLAAGPFTDIIFSGFRIANATANSPWYQSTNPPFITWNNIPVAPMDTPSSFKDPNQKWGLAPNLAASLQRLKTNGKGKRLLASFASGTDLSFINDSSNNFSVTDFYNAFAQSFMQQYGFDGVDFDMESNYSEYPQLLAQLSNEFGSKSKLVSHAPYGQGTFPCGQFSGDMMGYYVCPLSSQSSTPIVGNTVITDPANSNKQINSISWLNVQLYSGGNQGTASGAQTYYEHAITALNNISPSGISDANYFLLAGFAPIICDPDYTLWNQSLDKDAGANTCTGSQQTDWHNNNETAVVVMDAINGLVKQFGTDKSGQAKFGGVFLYSYRYYSPDSPYSPGQPQPGYTYQVKTWKQIGAALGLT